MKVLLLFSFFFTLAYGLYEDQVGDSDWRQSFLGHTTWMSFDNLSGGRRKVLLASEAGVLAAVKATSGKIAWRQELETNNLFAIVHHRSHLLTVSGSVNLIIRSWDTDSGLLKWEVPTSLPVPLNRRPLDSQWRPGGVLLEMSGAKRDQLVLVSGGVMIVYSTRSGKEQWNTTLPLEQGVPAALIVEGVQLKLWLLGKGQLLCLEGDIGKGQAVLTETHILDGSLLSQISECVLNSVADTEEWIPICSSESQIFIVDLKSSKLLPVQFEDEVQSSTGLPRIRSGPMGHVHIGSGVYRIEDGNTLKLVCVDCLIGEASSEKDETVTLIAQLDGQSLQIRNVKISEEVEIAADLDVMRGGVSRMKVMAFHKSDGTLTWRIALVREDASLSFLSQIGTAVWTREDALATIVTVEMVDLPSAQFDSEGFFSLLDSNANSFMLAIKRWKLQASLFQDLVRDVIDRGVASLIHPINSEELLRDKFNMRKLIVSVTAYNKIYAIDSSNGKVVWQLYLPSLRPLSSDDNQYLLYTLRSSSHPPHAPLMILIGKSDGCEGTAVYSFNPVSGELTNENEECLSHDIIQTLFLPIMDQTHKRVLVYLDAAGSIGCYPRGCGDVSFNDQSVFLYTADIISGILRGYKAIGENELAKEVWQIVTPPSEKILVVANKLSNDHAHSIGRVRANRDVQYKYLNPNMIAMVTKTTDASTKSSLAVYLVDSVTGGVVYRSTHRLAAGPVGILLCENWIMYHYFSVKSQRNELSVAEMYDPRNNTESVWSSLAPPTLPVVTTQSYVFPTSIATMATTVTQRGITSRSLLLGLNSGHIFLLRKDFLDPRRNLTLTQQMTEEGVPIYVPDIPMQPRSYINYNQTVSRMRGIRATPTGLESTSLVFAYGLDIYVTRVQSSGQFDLLAEDFDYLLIAGVVMALVVTTIVLSWLSRRKTLKRLWK